MRVLLSICAALGVAGVAASSAGAEVAISSNWAGYAASAPAHSSAHFGKVSGTWIEPTATCTAGQETYSAFWVGLGGFASSSSALEQIGTDADCSAAGTPEYYAWLELVPAAPIDLRLKVNAGDHLSASVAVSGHRVTLRIHDLTTGGLFLSTRRMSADPDLSSAEWIVEAPSICKSANDCTQLPLTDFQTVSFGSASARLGSNTYALGSTAWSLTQLELQEDSEPPHRPGPRFHNTTPGPASGATASAILNPLGSFDVGWREVATGAEQPSQGEQG